jgi:plastocyanin
VTFEWSGGAAHDLSVPGVGFEGAAKVAASYTVAFPSAGEYEMICIIHSATMKGKIIVE